MQTSYAKDPALGFAGMVSQSFSAPTMLESGVAEGAIFVGDAVEAGSAGSQVAPLAALIDFAGLAVFSQGIEKEDGVELRYKDKKALPYMTKGRVWVKASAAVVKGAEVIPSLGATTKFAAGTGTGKVRAVALTAAAADGDIFQVELTGPVL